MRRLACVLALAFSVISASAQVQPVRVGQNNIGPPRKTKDVRPVYPAIAQSARVQGVVVIETTIGPDGHVAEARVLRSIPLLDDAALAAVKQWEFTPTLLNGAPVPVIMTVTVNFTLQNDLMPRVCSDEPSMRSPEGAASTTIQFINQTDSPRKLYWLDATGVRHWYQTVAPGESILQTTAVGHTWVVTDGRDVCSTIFVARRSQRAAGFWCAADPFAQVAVHR
jgi:TonB family protein